jgi:hypothetical protein
VNIPFRGIKDREFLLTVTVRVAETVGDHPRVERECLVDVFIGQGIARYGKGDPDRGDGNGNNSF